MKEVIARFFVPVLIGIIAFSISRYFFQPTKEITKLECLFTATEKGSPVAIPYSQHKISSIDYRAELTGNQADAHDDGVILLHADGVASYLGGYQRMSGSVFLLPTNKVRALALYRNNYPSQSNDLRIFTLNKDGNLSSNEDFAFVYFDNSANKVSNSFKYRCNIVQRMN